MRSERYAPGAISSTPVCVWFYVASTSELESLALVASVLSDDVTSIRFDLSPHCKWNGESTVWERSCTAAS